jgi:hypothetical protein
MQPFKTHRRPLTHCPGQRTAFCCRRIGMLRIYQVETDQDRDHFRDLSWEYLQWANSRVNEEYGISFDIKSMLDQDLLELDKFLPP